MVRLRINEKICVRQNIYLTAFVQIDCQFVTLQGSAATIIRAMVVNATELATYSESKHVFLLLVECECV
jgi:hypothetical protein